MLRWTPKPMKQLSAHWLDLLLVLHASQPQHEWRQTKREADNSEVGREEDEEGGWLHAKALTSFKGLSAEMQKLCQPFHWWTLAFTHCVCAWRCTEYSITGYRVSHLLLSEMFFMWCLVSTSIVSVWKRKSFLIHFRWFLWLYFKTVVFFKVGCIHGNIAHVKQFSNSIQFHYYREPITAANWEGLPKLENNFNTYFPHIFLNFIWSKIAFSTLSGSLKKTQTNNKSEFFRCCS